MRKILFAVCFLISSFSDAGFAASEGGTENVRASLLVETSGLRAGTVLSALRLKMRDGWHSYWVNPGDSGMETAIEWDLPSGVSAGAIQWPTPERIPVGPLVNYGYGHEALLLVPLTVDPNLAVGQIVTLRAKATWLACAEICIPEEAELSLDLPVLENAPASADASSIVAAQAALPGPSPWPIVVSRNQTEFRMTLSAPGVDPAQLRDIHFFPVQNGAVQAAAPQIAKKTPQGIELSLTIGDLPPAIGAPLEGVLVMTEPLGDRTVRNSFLVSATLANPAIDPSAEVLSLGLGAALILAFAGGLILNLMPCVLPILAMKAMNFGRREDARRNGLAYAAGVMLSFLIIAGVMLALRASGAQIGWGFQLQSPIVVAALACLTFGVGLSFSGLVTVGGSFAGVGGGLAARGGTVGALFTGILAVLVATPCTAPFMGAALGYALVQPTERALAVFLALGAGMAAPFTVLSFIPRAASLLPKPGIWMDRLKQFLAFPMYLTAAWLVWVLSLQIGSNGVLAVLLAMVALAFAGWCYETTTLSGARWRLVGRSFAALGVAGTLYLLQGLPIGGEASAPSPGAAATDGPLALKVGAVTWETYTPEKLSAARRADRPVLLNVTAAWCITCLVNEKVALSSPRVAGALLGAGVVTLKADWTRRDAGITDLLAGFGRNGVPLYALYPKGGRPSEVLPQILTEAEVMAAIGRLAPAS